MGENRTITGELDPAESNFSFLTKPDGYSPENAYWLGRFSQLAYSRDTDLIKAEMSKLGLHKFEFFDRRGTQAFAAGNDSITVLAFRGTESNEIMDLVSDANALQSPGPWGKIHSGFSNAVSQIWDDVSETVGSWKDGEQTLWITGHSLGAALATLAAAKFYAAGADICGVYTYGQPRTGDPEFADAYDAALKDRHFRFVNKNDLVTRVALEKLKFRGKEMFYRHIGSTRYFKWNGSLASEVSWIDRFLCRVIAAFQGNFTPALKDHSISGYLDLLQNARGN